MHASRTARAAVAVVTALALVGCKGPLSKRAQDVAKDWSKVIRANQVIPVYPMTEDLEPGDVFLVDAPVNEQADRYESEGYLPLDNHLVRLPAPGYRSFYRDGYWRGYGSEDARDRPRPDRPDEDAPEDHRFGDSPAPMAAFPSYSFSVERGGGLDLGLPISGVPIAMGLMAADRGEASVTINDALTYGVGTVELWDAVRGWAEQPLVRAKLSHLHSQNISERTGPPRLFLRVVSRVYLTGGVSVTVNRADLRALDARGGADRSVELPGLLSTDAAQAAVYQANLEGISTSLSDAMPGGAIKLGYASSSSVSLQEQFERPLAIGYLGFDVPLYAGGALGAPVATRQVLLREAQPPATLSQLSADQRQFDLRAVELQHQAVADPDLAAAVCRRAATTLPTATFASLQPEEAPDVAFTADEVVERFLIAAERYVSRAGDSGLSYKEIVSAIDAAQAAALQGGGD